MAEQEPTKGPTYIFKNSGEPDSLRVVELGSGEEVFRPDIAKIAMDAFGRAVEGAGGEFDVPDDISSLFSDEVRGIEPPKEL